MKILSIILLFSSPALAAVMPVSDNLPSALKGTYMYRDLTQFLQTDRLTAEFADFSFDEIQPGLAPVQRRLLASSRVGAVTIATAAIAIRAAKRRVGRPLRGVTTAAEMTARHARLLGVWFQLFPAHGRLRQIMRGIQNRKEALAAPIPVILGTQ